jgi:hypothetical protein
MSKKRLAVDMRTFRHAGVEFRPTGKVIEVGEVPQLEANPVKRHAATPLTARLFVGLSVGQERAWTVEDVINVTQEVRLRQKEAPDASFLVQRGLYTDRSSEIVREDSVQVVLFNFGDDMAVFEAQMVELAEELIDRLRQETIYVELQKNGVPHSVLEVTA